MRTLTNPRWLLLINTLPVVILLLIFWRQYQVIHTLLEPQSIQLWKVFGLTLVSLGLFHLAYTLWLVKKGKALPPSTAWCPCCYMLPLYIAMAST